MGGVLTSHRCPMNQIEIAREFPLSDAQFRQVREKLYALAGIALADHKKDMVYNRLVRRLRALGFTDFDQYLAYLNQHEEEPSLFINALTTNLTSFFREKHHFDFVENHVIPELKHGHRRRLRFWSAGCSMGEEAYSLAIALLNSGFDPLNWDLKILATDVDSSVLKTAQTGIYNKGRSTNLSDPDLKRWFYRGKGSQQGLIRAKPELKNLISFRHLNLMNSWPMSGSFDVIFCRNVMIYFDQPTQAMLLQRMAEKLRTGGYLFVGHSESLIRQQQQFQLIGRTIYRKVGEA